MKTHLLIFSKNLGFAALGLLFVTVVSMLFTFVFSSTIVKLDYSAATLVFSVVSMLVLVASISTFVEWKLRTILKEILEDRLIVVKPYPPEKKAPGI